VVGGEADRFADRGDPGGECGGSLRVRQRQRGILVEIDSGGDEVAGDGCGP
jgi:hypothetical protein